MTDFLLSHPWLTLAGALGLVALAMLVLAQYLDRQMGSPPEDADWRERFKNK